MKGSVNDMKVCEHCIEAIRSHGEKLIILENLFEEGTCEWCGETDELSEVAFDDDDDE